MSEQNNVFIKILQNQKAIRILFIVLNALAWYADNISQEELTNNQKNRSETPQFIYNFILTISILVNIYYIVTIQEQIVKSNQNTKNLETRRDALILLVISLSILLYSQNSTGNVQPIVDLDFTNN